MRADNPTGELGAAQRAASLAALAESADATIDLVVIGGGVTGAGCALDAAARGLSVVLLEQSDIAAGTSSRSSKLIHGGLRYLEQWRFGLVREALRERSLIASKLAPHLVSPVSFLYLLPQPRTRLAGLVRRFYVRVGVTLYDFLARIGVAKSDSLPRHKKVGAEAAQRLAPSLDQAAHHGGVIYWDAQTDDARHTLALARTAATYGAHVLTSVQVTGVATDAGAGNPAGDTAGDTSTADTGTASTTGDPDTEGTTIVTATDRETGKQLRISAAAVINATGVWSDDLDALASKGIAAPPGDTAPNNTAVRVSKGIHLVIERDRIDSSTGMVFTTNTSVLFVIPWPASSRTASGSFTHWIIGTTDTDWKLDRTHPAASHSDIEYLLTEINKVLAKPLSEADVCGVYAGLRPLLTGEDSDTSKLSREHSVTQPAPRMVSIKGGKYTTYRVMAAAAVDAAVSAAGLQAPRSATASLPLMGASGWQRLLQRCDEIAGESGLSLTSVMHLLSRHGDQIPAVLDLIAANDSLAGPLVPGLGYLRAEVVYAVRAEAALHLDDVLTRRTRLSVETPDRAVNVAAEVAQLMATELGWTAQQTQDEVRYYTERVDAERASQMSETDQSAAAARLAAVDARQRGPRLG